ncbi:MAG: phage terminase small subunit P27 family [Syntrophus sp. (in: bacteria)]|nr:phage terminase small subunit P27 family [Syntrophus sp. (in: bacteria)]
MARLPKPTAVLQFEKGKLYADQRDRAALEPKPEKELKPRCPARFSKEERKVWKDIAAVLKNYGLFTVANSIQLELLTTAWVQYLECCEKMTENKEIIIKGPEGGSMYNPWFNAQHRLGALVDKYSQNLGLSSIALAKIGTLMLKGKKKSAMEELLD